MKTLKAICPAVILALALAAPTFAGDIQTPGSPAPQPTPSHMSTTAETSSELIAEPLTSCDNSTSFADILWALTSIF